MSPGRHSGGCEPDRYAVQAELESSRQRIGMTALAVAARQPQLAALIQFQLGDSDA